MTSQLPLKQNLPPLALLCGGLATRLRPVTATIPKSMVEVAGRPFIAHQLEQLVRAGIRRVVICAGHLASHIMEFVGDGNTFGLAVEYSLEGEHLLGTGGALRRALPRIDGSECFVMYGDSWLDIAFEAVDRHYHSTGKPALMTVFRNEGRWDTSNVVFADGMVRRYDKHERDETMHYIDYGLSVLSCDLIRSWPENTTFDLADIFTPMAAQGLIAGFEAVNRFYEIGSPAGRDETDLYLRRSTS